MSSTSPVYAATTPLKAASKSAETITSQGSSPSATAEETTLELKKRIEKVIEKSRDKVKGAVTNILSEKTGFIGEVTRLSQEALSIKQLNGDTKIIPLDESITLVKEGKKISPDSIEVGNWVIVIGNKTPSGDFEPEFIVVKSKSLRPKPKQVMIGTITKISKNGCTILPRGESEEKEFSFDSKAQYQNVDGATLKVTDFSKDVSVLVIAADEQNGESEITTMRSLIDVKATKK